MPSFKDLARVTGRKLPDVSSGELPTNAWLVHQSIINKLKRSHAANTPLNGADGYEWRGYVKSVMREFWPDLPDGRAVEADPEANRAQEDLYRYLRRSGNMKCLENGLGRGESLWWVRAEWIDDVPDLRKNITGKAVKKESGEKTEPEHAPAPAEPQYKCPHCPASFSSKQRRSAHIFRYARHESLEEWMIKALKAIPLPASPKEVHTYLETAGFAGSIALTTNSLHDLAEDARSDVIKSMIPGRERVTYALISRLSEVRTAAAFAPFCREPGCGAGPFKHLDPRGRHELKRHHSSPNRPWQCFFPDTGKKICGAAFYDEPGLGIHLMRSHHVYGTDNDERVDLVRQAAVKAAAHVPQVTAVPWGSRPEIGLMLNAETLTPAVVETSQQLTKQQAQSMKHDEEAQGQPAVRLETPPVKYSAGKASRSLLETAALVEELEQELIRLKRDNAALQAERGSFGAGE